MEHSLRRRAAISATPTRSAATPPASGATDAFSKRERTEKKKSRHCYLAFRKFSGHSGTMKKLSKTGPKENECGSESDTRKRRIVEL
jgi:hypothetical protein